MKVGKADINPFKFILAFLVFIPVSLLRAILPTRWWLAERIESIFDWTQIYPVKSGPNVLSCWGCRRRFLRYKAYVLLTHINESPAALKYCSYDCMMDAVYRKVKT
jgi:hypothetical protein